MERHEILHTNIVASGGVPIQVIAKNRSVQFRVIDLDERPDGVRQAALHDLLRSEASRPFNLSADLMLRAMVVRLAENDHVLLLVMHHIASDGWSISILLDELSALYGAFCENRPSPLVDLPIQYGDFALWQRQWLRGERLETQLSYWKKPAFRHHFTGTAH